MLNGNKSASSKRRAGMFDAVVRATKKSVIAGRAKRGDRRAANQNVWKEASAD